jgi:hypothetical protein
MEDMHQLEERAILLHNILLKAMLIAIISSVAY